MAFTHVGAYLESTESEEITQGALQQNQHKTNCSLGGVAQALNLTYLGEEAKTEGWPVQELVRLQSEFKASLGNCDPPPPPCVQIQDWRDGSAMALYPSRQEEKEKKKKNFLYIPTWQITLYTMRKIVPLQLQQKIPNVWLERKTLLISKNYMKTYKTDESYTVV